MGLDLGKLVENSTRSLGDKIKLPGGKSVKIPYGKTLKLPGGKKIKLPSKHKKTKEKPKSVIKKEGNTAPPPKTPVNCNINNENNLLKNKNGRDRNSVQAKDECPPVVTPEAIHAITKSVPELDVSKHIKDTAVHNQLMHETAAFMNSSFIPAGPRSFLQEFSKQAGAGCKGGQFQFGNLMHMKGGFDLSVGGFDLDFKHGFNLPDLKFPKINLKDLSKYLKILNINWKDLLDKFPHIKLPDIHWPDIDWPDINFKFWDSVPSFNISWPSIDWDGLKDIFPDIDWDGLKIDMPKISWPELVLKYPDLDWPSFDYDWPDIDWPKLKVSFPDIDWDGVKVDFPDITWPELVLKYPDLKWFETSWFSFPDIDWPDIDWPSVSFALPDFDWPSLNLNFPSIDWPRLNASFPDIDWDGIKADFPDITWPDIMAKFPKLDWPSFNLKTPSLKWPDLFLKLPKIHFKKLFDKLKLKLPKINWLKLLKKLPKLDLSEIAKYFKNFKFPDINWKDIIKKFPKLDWKNLILKIDIKWPQFILDHPEIDWVAIVIGVLAVGSIAALMHGSLGGHGAIKAVGLALGASAIGMVACRQNKKDATSRMLTTAASTLPGGLNKAKALNKAGKLDAKEFSDLTNDDSSEAENFNKELASGNVKKIGLDKSTAVSSPAAANNIIDSISTDKNLHKAATNKDLVTTANAVATSKNNGTINDNKLSGSQKLSIAGMVSSYNKKHKNDKGFLAKNLKKKSTIKTANKVDKSAGKFIKKELIGHKKVYNALKPAIKKKGIPLFGGISI